MSVYSIGQVAKQSGVSVETVRYYEKEGLLEVPERKESGYRQFKGDAIARLSFIQQAKKLGFSLKEIGELLSIKSDANTVCNDVKQLSQEKLVNIENKIKMLQRMRKSLKKLIDVCPGQAPINDCPILDALQKKGF
jgi:Zn(II)-responsive transcriptional regulator